jgi:lysine-N-methylase
VGWRVSVDQDTYKKYQALPEGPVRTLIDANVLRSPAAAGEPPPAAFAHIQMTPRFRCPFLSEDRLCQIQIEYGEPYLSQVCATFPRTVHTIDHLEEKTLSLSCPEAARVVLLDPDLLRPNPKAGRHHLSWDDQAEAMQPLRSYFWPIREFAIALARNRAYPLWQRMFLLGAFCRRLEGLVSGQLERGFPAFLRDFSAAVGSGSLRCSMEALPADLALQLDMVMRLVNLRMPSGQSQFMSFRLLECLRALVEGVGQGPEYTLADQIDRYASAYKHWYEPFFLKHPYMLENYLVNTILRGLFPFGPKLFDAAATPAPGREFALLALQFALIKGLLIGVAGYHRQAFCAERVVEVVQTACKYFEHDPEFLSRSYELLVAKGLDNVHGVTMLLRN